jgi:hypothetical protein
MPGLHQEISSTMQRFEIRFDIKSPAGSGYATFRLAGKDGGPALSLTFASNSVYLYTYNPKHRQRGNHQSITLHDKTRGLGPTRSVRLFVNTVTGTSDLFVSGERAAHLGKDAGDQLSEGDYSARIQLSPQGISSSALANLWIGPWSGELPKPTDATGPSTALVNGDVAPGTPKAMRDGKWSLESDLGNLELPAEKIMSVDFGGDLHPHHTAARLRLADGSSLNVDDFHWKEHELTAHSATLGDLRLPAAAIAELIYDPALPHAPMNPEPKDLAEKAPADPAGKQ